MAQGIVGLDIGSSAVRAVELTIGDRGMASVLAYGQIGLPNGLIVAGEVRNSAQVGQAIRRLWQQGGFTGKAVHLGVAGLRVITRELDMQVVHPEELDSAVQFQAAEIIPFPLEQAMISAKVLVEYTSPEGASMMRVLVAAAHRELVDGVVEAVQAAGLQPASIDLNTAAIARSFGASANGAGLEAIVSVGGALTLVIVHKDGQVQFVRTIDLGGQSITDGIAGAFDIPRSDAEMLKVRLGEGAVDDPSTRAAAKSAVDAIVSEVQNSLQFFSSLPAREQIVSVALTGGGIRTPGLVDELARNLSWPVDAFPGINVDTSRLGLSPAQERVIQPTLAVPVGLALPDSKGKSFNLLPPEIEEGDAARRINRWLLVAAGVVLVAMVGLSAWRIFQVRSAQHSVNTLQSQVSTIQTVDIPKYSQAVALKNSVEAQQSQIVPAVSGEVDWLVVLNQLSQYVPPTATYSNLTMATTPVVPTAPTPAKGAAPSSTATSPPTTASPATPSATTVIATLSGAVSVGNLAEVTQWGQALTGSSIFINVGTGALSATPGGVNFSSTTSINGLAGSQRVASYREALP